MQSKAEKQDKIREMFISLLSHYDLKEKVHLQGQVLLFWNMC